MDNVVRGVLYYPCSMVLGQFFCRFTGSAAQTHCARRSQFVSKKFLEEEIFAGTNFRELAFDPENCENFCLAKISRYTYLPTAGVISCIPHCDKNIECMTGFAPHSGYGEGVDECQLQDDWS